MLRIYCSSALWLPLFQMRSHLLITSFSLCAMCHFSMPVFKRLLLLLVFKFDYEVPKCGFLAVYSVLSCWACWKSKLMFFTKFEKLSAIISLNTFLPLLSFWNFWKIKIISEVPGVLLVFVQYIFSVFSQLYNFY